MENTFFSSWILFTFQQFGNWWERNFCLNWKLSRKFWNWFERVGMRKKWLHENCNLEIYSLIIGLGFQFKVTSQYYSWALLITNGELFEFQQNIWFFLLFCKVNFYVSLDLTWTLTFVMPFFNFLKFNFKFLIFLEFQTVESFNFQSMGMQLFFFFSNIKLNEQSPSSLIFSLSLSFNWKIFCSQFNKTKKHTTRRTETHTKNFFFYFLFYCLFFTQKIF